MAAPRGISAAPTIEEEFNHLLDRALREQARWYERRLAELQGQLEIERERHARQFEMARQMYSHRFIETPRFEPWLTESDPRLSPVFFSAVRSDPESFNPGAIAPGEVITVSEPHVSFWEPHPEARARARKLLLDHLTPEQRQTYERNRYFHVRSSSGATWTVSEEVTRRLTDRHSFCIEIAEAVPVEDNLLMRKLLLETNEAEFLRVANDLTEMTAGHRGVAYYANMVIPR